MPPPSTALGLDQHGATLPTTTSLVTAIAELRAGHSDHRHTLVLLAASVTNAAEIADVHGAQALEVVTGEVTRRAMQHDGVRVRLLRSSPLGGFLAAAVVRRETARAEVEDLFADVRGLVDLVGDQVWPVLTVGAAECDVDDRIWSVIRDVRSAVVAAGREAPGAIRWHEGVSTYNVADELTRVRDLAVALTQEPGQLQLHYQPVQNLRDGALVGAEALLRWTHPLRGPISPMLAVEAAERTGLIVPLGRLVLDRALAQTAVWLQQLHPGFRMHVNVSPIELGEPSYVDHVEAALARAGVPAANLLLEITETAMLNDEPAVHATLLGLRELGVGLGVDDFGTGYSSIAHLHRLPIDTVKVDRSLISGMGDDVGAFQRTRAVIGLVTTLGVTVVAEGIESALESAHLQAMGCSIGQGYHLGRPVPAAEFLPATHAPGRTA
ncbi:EAL domain-containing protein [Nocardioides sp. 1609]|uniref:EAL domain-containing protein n=1 Tax=Nocardioides sp. 1609 TaxID=2508327 RepID=UPI00106FE5B4|nr:EAL domain-containing protein [Nocardioides sp. 1609]